MFRNTRTRLVSVIAAATIGALTLTACNDATITDKPKARGKVSTETKQDDDKPAETEEEDAAPEVAKVGDTIGLSGMEDGQKLDVTVVKIVDPAKSSDGFTVPEDGNRFVGIQFQLVNTGAKVYSDSPSNGAQITDEQGQQFMATFADISAGPSMSASVKLKPGAKALGWITFEVPKNVDPDIVQFSMDSGFADETGEWKLK